MKKFVAVLVFVLLFFFVGSALCETAFVFTELIEEDDAMLSSPELTDSGKTPANPTLLVLSAIKNEYVVFYNAPDTIYSTPASENGLDEVYMFVYGTASKFDTIEGFEGVVVETDKGQIWLGRQEQQEIEVFANNAEWKSIEIGKSYGVFFKYYGFSDLKQMPCGLFCNLEESYTLKNDLTQKPQQTSSSTASQTQSPAPTKENLSQYQKILDDYSAKIRNATPSLISEYKSLASSYRGNIEKLAELANNEVTKLAEILTAGTSKMAAHMQSTGGSYGEYESWAGKLYDVYEKEAGKIMDAYINSAI